MRRSRRRRVDEERVKALAERAREFWDGLTPEQRAQVQQLADRAVQTARETFATRGRGRRRPGRRL